jgi:hypothetical protein
MKTTRKTKITVERERLLVISRQRRQVVAWCQTCSAEVDMLAVEEAAALTGLSQRAVFRLLEAGSLHFTENHESEVLICLNSLLKQTEKEISDE